MTKPIIVLFPGQGSQFVGMGSSLLGTPGEEYLDRSDEILGYSLKTMMLKGPPEDLNLTVNAQPAILAHSWALFCHLETILAKAKESVDLVMGHSVGEYSALVAAGSLTFDEALLAVHKRGLYMQEAVPQGRGAMYAVLKIPDIFVERACREVSTPNSQVVPANYNAPGQIVVSGISEACEKLLVWFRENYRNPWKSVKLPVSAPFHSPLMEPAASRLEAHLNTLNIRPNKIAYRANVDAREYPVNTPGNIIGENLYRQVCGSVLWSRSVKDLPEGSHCVECGPGRVLTGLGRKINPPLRCIPLDREGGFAEIEQLVTQSEETHV